MIRSRPIPSFPPSRRSRARGSVLLSTLLIAAVIGLGLTASLRLSHSAHQLSQRSFYLSDAANLAEAGLEEAVYSFRLVDAGTALATAWTGWTLTGGNATLTLPSFNRSHSAVGTVKVFVTGYNASSSTPSVISQATITPLDGSAPVRKTLKVTLSKKGGFTAGLIAISGLNLGTHSTVDSFNSNPTGDPAATPLAYPGLGAAQNGNVVVYSGTADVGEKVYGNLLLGPGVTAPASSKVTGSIVNNVTGANPLPTFPTVATINISYALASVPATLPRAGDAPASDGRYYYFVAGVMGDTSITNGKNVTVVPASVNITGSLTIQSGATCIIYTAGTFATKGTAVIDNQNWAGALQIISSTTGKCDLAQKGTACACIYAPLAEVTANGGGSSPAFVGSIVAKTLKTSANIVFHYDERLLTTDLAAGAGWKLTNWFELQSAAEKAGVAALTGGFLQ